jgi:anti-anti-sigma factor
MRAAVMVEPSPFAIDSQREDGSARVTVTGELDLATVSQLEQEVRRTLAQGVDQLTIDLSGLTFIDD